MQSVADNSPLIAFNLSFSEAAKVLPRIDGKRIHPATLWRWARKGCRGVRLETRRYGGRYVTSREALDRFGRELAAVPLPSDDTQPAPQPKRGRRGRTSRQRQRDIRKAELELRAAGIIAD